MSERDMCVNIIDGFSSFQLKQVLAYLRGMLAEEDAEDDEFCAQLLESYRNDPDRNEPGMPIEEYAAKYAKATKAIEA